MSLDAMLVRLVGKLLAALGETAAAERTGRLAAPVESWTGRDLLNFVEQLRHAAGDDYMGLAAAPCPLGTADFMIELGSRCATLGDALDCCFRLLGIVTTGLRCTLAEEGDVATIGIRQAPSPRDPEHALSDWNMIAWHKLAQWLIGASVPLLRTEFDHPLDSSYTSYASMFGSECTFNADACRLVFPAAYLRRRVVLTPREAKVLRISTPGYFSKPVGLATTWKETISSILRAEILAGQPLSSIEALAVQFGVSSQTLRRRLRIDRTSYRSLKNQARHEAALDVLGHEGATLAAASLAAGFAEAGALGRSLRSQRGEGPQVLRDQVRRWRKPGAGGDAGNQPS